MQKKIKNDILRPYQIKKSCSCVSITCSQCFITLQTNLTKLDRKPFEKVCWADYGMTIQFNLTDWTVWLNFMVTCVQINLIFIFFYFFLSVLHKFLTVNRPLNPRYHLFLFLFILLLYFGGQLTWYAYTLPQHGDLQECNKCVTWTDILRSVNWHCPTQLAPLMGD